MCFYADYMQQAFLLAAYFFSGYLLDNRPGFPIFVNINTKTNSTMKRFFAVVIAIFAVSNCFAQETNPIIEAQIRYDEAVLMQKQAIIDARNDERRAIEIAEQRVEDSKNTLLTLKQTYKTIVEEQKQRVADAKREVVNAKIRLKEESKRAKQETQAAKATTKSVLADKKSQVARAKAEIARLKVEANK